MVRALARVDVGAIERNCARLAAAAAPAAAVRGRQGGRLRARGRARPRGRRRRAARSGWRWPPRSRPRSCARPGSAGPLLVLGRAVGRGAADRAGAPAPTWSRGARTSPPRWRARAGGGVHVKLDTGMGRLGTRDRREASRVVEAVAADPALRLAGVMTHFATADEDDPSFLREQLARVRRLGRACAAHPGVLVHAANSAATLAEPAARFDMVRCGIAHLRAGPVPARPGRAAARAGAGAAQLRGRGQALRARAERRLRAQVRRRARDLAGHDPDRLRGRRAPRAHQQRRGASSAAAASRCVGIGVDGQHHRRPRPGAGRRARRAGRADRRGACSPRSGPPGWAPSTTRSPAASRPACRASTTAADERAAGRSPARCWPARRRGWSAARCATGCSAATPTTSTSRWPATPSGRRGGSPRRPAAPRSGSPASSARGARSGPGTAGTSTWCRCAAATSPPTSRSATSRSTRWPSRWPAASSLDPHGGRADLEARRLRMVSPRRARARTRCGRCAPCGSPSSSAWSIEPGTRDAVAANAAGLDRVAAGAHLRRAQARGRRAARRSSASG